MAVRTRPSDGRALPRWVRLRPVSADPTAIHVTVTDPAAVTVDAVRDLRDRLHAGGLHTIVTNAMAPADAAPIVAAGFVVREELDLLARPLDVVARPRLPTHRSRELAAVVVLDARAFGEGAFDAPALDDARRATPAARLRVTGTPSEPTGYAVTGVAGRRAFLQRLAVDPGARRRGIGTALVLDGLRWAQRRGARTAVVNTHVGNDAAHALYLHLGFAPLPTGLVVLEHTR